MLFTYFVIKVNVIKKIQLFKKTWTCVNLQLVKILKSKKFKKKYFQSKILKETKYKFFNFFKNKNLKK